MKCGLPFDPLAAYDAGTKVSKQANMDEFQSMVQQEGAKLFGDMNVPERRRLQPVAARRERLTGGIQREPSFGRDDTLFEWVPRFSIVLSPREFSGVMLMTTDDVH